MKQIFIIGGGASGMMAAITAVRRGANVTLLEGGPALGKKLLATGNGRCNFTNQLQQAHCYHSSNPAFPFPIITRFNEVNTIAFFEQLGIYPKERNGYLYPHSDQAKAVVDVLVDELNTLGVNIVTNAKVTSIRKENHAYTIFAHKMIPLQKGKRSTSKETSYERLVYHADVLILACGSMAAPSTGSDGSGYELAKQLGHKIITPLPSLVQLRCEERFFKQLAGVRIQAGLQLFHQTGKSSKLLARDHGELQLTSYGISGIVTFQISGYATRALEKKQRPYAIIDFFPNLEPDALLAYLKKRIQLHPTRQAHQFFTGMLPDKLASVLLSLASISEHEDLHTITTMKLQHLVELMKSFKTRIVGSNDFDAAQVCSGGVSTIEINPKTLESIYHKNLYFTGELLDVDGLCGGYNLQWAWSSGHLAGTEASNA